MEDGDAHISSKGQKYYYNSSSIFILPILIGEILPYLIGCLDERKRLTFYCVKFSLSSPQNLADQA